MVIIWLMIVNNVIWLVVYLPLWKMMEFVSWDDENPNWMESHKNHSCSSHHLNQYIETPKKITVIHHYFSGWCYCSIFFGMTLIFSVVRSPWRSPPLTQQLRAGPHSVKGNGPEIVYIYIYTHIYIWVNYNISLTWILRPFGDDSPE